MFASAKANWKTTLGGAISAFFFAFGESLGIPPEATNWIVALFLGWLGYNARDHNVSSEASGAATP